MSDINTAEMTREQLEATATEIGVEFRANIGDDTLRQRINEKLGNVDPEAQTRAAQEQSQPQQQAPSANPPATPSSQPAVNTTSPAKPKRKRIIVATHEQDSQPVQVGVNGRMYVIQRGEEVVVPESVVEVLTNAIQHVYDPKTMKESRVMAYPFQVLGDA